MAADKSKAVQNKRLEREVMPVFIGAFSKKHKPPAVGLWIVPDGSHGIVEEGYDSI
jgi:hypothetical protein